MTTAETPAFWSDLGDDVGQRPRPTMRGALAAVGSTLCASGLFMVAGEKLGEGSKVLPIVVGLVIIAAGYGALFGLAAKVKRPLIEPAAVAAISIGALIVALLAPIDFDNPEATTSLLAATVALGIVWIVPGTRGRPLPLGLALAGLWLLLLDATTDSFSASVGGGASVADDGSLVSLVYGVALLLGAYFLDRSEHHGVLATPLVAVGNIAYIVGTFGVIGNLAEGTEAGTSIMVIAAGLVLAFVGNAGLDRRFTTWTGAAGVLFGVFSLVAAIFDDTSSPTAPGLLLATIGLALAAGAIAWDSIRAGAAPASAVAASPGWYPDPTARYEQRYHDGADWTSHVIVEGRTMTDPHGAH